MVDDERFRQDLTAKSTNWRVNNAIDWCSRNFPNIAKMTLKYLAVPASSTTSERVFPN